MGERARIARYFAPLAAAEPGSFSLTDDAAVLTPPAGKSLVITTDSVIETIHVLAGATPQQFAQKLVRRNLSDLAAMGAEPWRYTLNLHTPSGLPDVWFAEFAATLAAEETRFGMVLVGGDSTSAPSTPIHTTMTCFGLLEGKALTRLGAQEGDAVYVSGTIGDAALGLSMLQQTLPPEDVLIARYHVPQPRLALGKALRSIATAAIDISDGLISDIAQLQIGARIERDAIPLSEAARRLLHHQPDLWEAVLNGGDDYELCFTAPASGAKAVDALAQQLDLPLTRIGMVVNENEIIVQDAKGTPLPVTKAGYEYR